MSRRKKEVTIEGQSLLTVAQVAKQLGVCRNTVYKMIYTQGLKSVMVGSARRVRPETLEAWMKAREQSA